MASNGNGRKRGSVLNRSIDGDDALDPALRENVRVSIQKLGIVAVDHRQKEVIALAQVLLNAADDPRTIGVANLFGNDTNGVGALVAESTGEKVRTVVEFLGGRVNAVLGFLGNGASRGGIVEDG